jgi:limonene-1,2-epoxide hydrolase
LTLGSQQEAIVRSWFDSMRALDLDAAIDHFADDATYHVAAWHEPLVGREAIRRGLEREFVALSSAYDHTIRNVASTDAVVFVEVLDQFKFNGNDVTMHSVWVFEVDGAGKITARRDYFDAKEFEARLT